MRCCQCIKKFNHDGILVTCDGDFVCSNTCKINWENERDKFFNEIVHDDKKFEEWMKSNDTLT